MYTSKKEGTVAFQLGAAYFNKSKSLEQDNKKLALESAINFLAEAYILQNEDKESDAYKFLITIYFREYKEIKTKTVDTNNPDFLKLIEEAKARVQGQ
jgi:hypothetical protein